MPKGKKRQVGKWYRTLRVLNGEKRWVKVKRNADGSESVKVIFPKNAKLEETNATKKLKGLAKARKLDSQRNKTARTRDKRQKAQDTRTPTAENIEAWRKNPRRVDIQGVDTP